MVALGLAGLVFAAFVVRVIVEPRSFGNAVLLGLALALGALGVVEHLAGAPGRPAHLLLVLLHVPNPNMMDILVYRNVLDLQML